VLLADADVPDHVQATRRHAQAALDRLQPSPRRSLSPCIQAGDEFAELARTYRLEMYQALARWCDQAEARLTLNSW